MQFERSPQLSQIPGMDLATTGMNLGMTGMKSAMDAGIGALQTLGMVKYI